MILFGVNFDLRITRENVPFEDWVAYIIAQGAYHFAFFGLLFSMWVLFRSNILSPVVRETAKVTSMVFTILIGSQLLNLVLISFGGEHYIQQYLRSFDNEWVVFLVVMLILFILGFVLDFLEIIYIVIPIVGPVIYGGTLDPAWVTIMIAVNLQTSFLTPPFGFALFYLARRGASGGDDGAHLSRGSALCGHPGDRPAVAVLLPADRHLPAGYHPDLRRLGGLGSIRATRPGFERSGFASIAHRHSHGRWMPAALRRRGLCRRGGGRDASSLPENQDHQPDD
jgi:hypothetical protein